ncbi:MAG: 4Fe-4S binding protein [Bacteroidota bacterium]|nr:4Fe-4S binding protein [Bacteroidota bacterium]
MNLNFLKHENRTSKYVLFDPGKCRACWICIGNCPHKVIGRVNLPWHKHALIVNGNKCTGCLKCVKVCPYGAFSKKIRFNNQ